MSSLRIYDQLHPLSIILRDEAEIVETAKKSCNGHSKRFKYITSHKTGKIEILGILDNEIYFKYHQAKDTKNLGRIFKRKADKNAGWLDDFKVSKTVTKKHITKTSRVF